MVRVSFGLERDATFSNLICGGRRRGTKSAPEKGQSLHLSLCSRLASVAKFYFRHRSLGAAFRARRALRVHGPGARGVGDRGGHEEEGGALRRGIVTKIVLNVFFDGQQQRTGHAAIALLQGQVQRRYHLREKEQTVGKNQLL